MSADKAILAVLEPLEGFATRPGPVEILKNAQAPFVFWLQEAQDEEEALDGPVGLLEATFEVNVVAVSYAQLITLAERVRKALQGMQGNTYDGILIERAHVTQRTPDLREREVGLFRRGYALHLNYQEED